LGSLYHPTVKRMNKDGSFSVYEDPIWWASYNVKGRRIRRSTERTKKGEANRQLLKWEADGDVPERKSTHAVVQVEVTPVPAPQGDVRLEELLDDFVEYYELNGLASVGQARCYRKRLLEEWPGALASDVTTREILVFRKSMKDEGYANAAVNRYLAALKRSFRLGMAQGRIALYPFIPMLSEKGNVRKGFIGDVEQAAILEQCPLFAHKVLYETAYTFGWRENELLSLEVSQVDLTTGIIHLHTGTTKNDDGREVMLTGDLLEMYRKLDAIRKALEVQLGRPIPWVFFYERNYHSAKAGDRIKDFRGTWKKVVRDAKLGKRLFHDFRRSAARNMENAGVPRSSGMRTLGQRTESIYRRYAIRNRQDMLDTTKQIEARKEQVALALKCSRSNNGQTTTPNDVAQAPSKA